MLEKIASRFQTIVLVGLVVLLSAVFVLQFGGPQAEGCTAGGSTYAARVDGETIGIGEFAAVYRLVGFQDRPPEEQRRQRLWKAVLDGIIERHLLATAAKEVGFTVSDEEVMNHLVEEKTVRVSLGPDAPFNIGEVPVPVTNRDGDFDMENAKGFIQNYLRQSIGEFTIWQKQEELAARMRETVSGAVSVSPREVWEAYVRERDRATIAYVKFSPAYYREQLDPSEAELDAWIEANADEVQEEYEENQHRYTDLDPQVRSRHILIKASTEADDDVKAEARARAEALLARARAGEDFATLATENSEDEGSARRGGDLGFNPRGRMVGEFDEAQFGMEIGDISDIVETRFGFHIIKVIGKREGDVPEQEAKRELADRLYKEARSESMAEAAANEALERLAGGASLDELGTFLRGATPPSPEDNQDSAAGADPEEAVEAPATDDNPLAPRVEETRSFGRTENPIRGPFDSGPLVRDVFEHDLESPLPDAPFELGSDFFVYKVIERTAADRDDFDAEERRRIRDGLLGAKRTEALALYVRGLRDAAERSGNIRITSHELTVEREGPGSVTSDPAGIDCGSDCSASVEFGTMVRLRAETETGGRFLGWDGACSGRDETCIVQMTGTQTVSARFRGAPSRATPSNDEGDESEENSEDEAAESE